MELKAYLENRRGLVEDCLAGLLPQQGPLAGHYAALRYSLMAGGKRVRPLLAIAAAEALGGDVTAAMPTVCALECIHTYSLIHDDLPAMDDDDLRRGKPTNHKVFGEAEAILAGDGLLTLAFELLAGPDAAPGLDAADRLRIVHLVAVAAGSSGMVGGQSLDLAAEGRQITLDGLRRIHRCKTGALITASVQTGAILGRADQVQFARLTEYGDAIGLAFQMKDDLLNVEGDAALMGKAVGTDAEHRKATYPALLGIEESRRQLAATVDAAIASLADFDAKADPLRELALYILNRRR
ncbi:MAG: farnesyl diphosphate synthase [Thermodesulfobacteriota bacterium]